MNARTGSPDAAYFCIEVEGVVDPRWRHKFAGLEFRARSGGERCATCMLGWLSDQAQLHSVLAAIRDLGLVLVSVQRLADDAGARSQDA